MYKQLNSAVGIFDTHLQAEIAINAITSEGYSMLALSVLGGALVGWMVTALGWDMLLEKLEIPKVSIRQYEKALRTYKFLVVFQGNILEVEAVTKLLLRNQAEYANYHRVCIEEIYLLS
jgi:hypothetical protein